MWIRTVTSYVAMLALGIAIGVGINRPTAGQVRNAAPVAAAAGAAPTGRYQLTQGIVAGLLFIDTATGRIWELEFDQKTRRWVEFPSPVLRGGADR